MPAPTPAHMLLKKSFVVQPNSTPAMRNQFLKNLLPIQFHRITIDGTGTKSYASPAEYQSAVLSVLETIYSTQTGKAVFREFEERSTHNLKIYPFEGDGVNASARTKDLAHATVKGETVRNGDDGYEILGDDGKPIMGLGGGTDSEISFTPIIYAHYCRTHKKHKSGMRPDEVLFHEMTHATRQMRGILNSLPLGHMYDTEEEFFAILLANIYASETGRPYDIRESHHGHEHMSTDTDEQFLPKKDMSDYRYRLVSKLVHQEPDMCRELRSVRTPFNPIRRYFELQQFSVFIPQHPIHILPLPKPVLPPPIGPIRQLTQNI